MAELVVLNTFLRVGQYFVCLGNLFELLFGLFVPLIFVRMVLDGQLAVGLLDFGFGSIPMNAQHLVVIALFPVCHSCSPWAKAKGQTAKRGVVRISPSP